MYTVRHKKDQSASPPAAVFAAFCLIRLFSSYTWSFLTNFFLKQCSKRTGTRQCIYFCSKGCFDGEKLIKLTRDGSINLPGVNFIDFRCRNIQLVKNKYIDEFQHVPSIFFKKKLVKKDKVYSSRKV